MDRVRVRELLRRLEAGEDEVDAFWRVASDPKTGYARFRGGTERPPEIVLTRKLASLLERTAPELVAAARDVARAKLAGMGDDAVRAVYEIVVGDIADGRIARARLDAAQTVLQALGIGERAGMTVATQINVGPGTNARGGVPEGA
jgi:hypothetical protein